jgi:hypothetical protein
MDDCTVLGSDEQVLWKKPKGEERFLGYAYKCGDAIRGGTDAFQRCGEIKDKEDLSFIPVYLQ